MEILFEKGIPGFESYNYFNVSAIEGNERFYNIVLLFLEPHTFSRFNNFDHHTSSYKYINISLIAVTATHRIFNTNHKAVIVYQIFSAPFSTFNVYRTLADGLLKCIRIINKFTKYKTIDVAVNLNIFYPP